MATLGLSAADKDAVERFRKDVVEPSMTKLVILDFWAEWCGPCKQIAPMLEKVAADYADKGVVLAKVDVDAEKFIAAQFQVRSIPTVYAMFQGQPVADLTAIRSESQLKATLDQLLKQLPVASDAAEAEAEIEPLIAMAEQVLAEGDAERAISIFRQIAEIAPDNPEVHGGFVRALVAAGQLEEAEQHLAEIDAEAAKAPEIARARSALALAQEAPAVDDLAPLQAAVDAAPDDHAARYELAGGQMAAGDHDAAGGSLLHIIAADKDWNEGAARTRLLKLFEVVGLEDPWVGQQRRKLSAILFGLMAGDTTRLSIFPLPGALLFPRMHLPLHIFEPRYRAMVMDAMARDRRIGMVQPRPGLAEKGQAAKPLLFDIGCVGRIADVEMLEDGRSNVVLEGIALFRILRELDVTTAFRQVEAELLPARDDETLALAERSSLEMESRRFADAQGYAVDWEAVTRLDDEALVNGIAQIAPFDTAAKQALLEASTLAERADLIVQLMQFFGRHDGEDRVTLQ